MIPHSYAVDTQTKATELASLVAAAVSPAQIAAACAAVESFLRKHTPDQQRWFFSITFPNLICRIFGFDDPSPPSDSTKRNKANGWIDVAVSENDSELGGRIFSLLSPNGLLLSSISGIDRLSLVKYVFPIERLPEWVRYMLQREQDCRTLTDLCPLFKNRIKEDSIKGSSYQVQLNAFEYYLFWFAYYPVCRGNSEGSETVKVHRTKKFRLENWSYSIPGLTSTKRETEKKAEGNLYIRLLYVYLHSFMPVQDLSVQQPFQSSLLQYSSGYGSSASERAEFVVNTMMQFWLVDNDFSPLSVSLSKAFGITFPFRSVLGETPPTAGLGDMLTVFVKYVNMSSLSAMEGPSQIDHFRSPGWGVSSSFDTVKFREATLSPRTVGSWNLMIQRPLYRFILRTFLFCPVGTSIKNASHAFSVWTNYMEPWSSNFDEFAHLNVTLELPTGSSANDGRSASCPGYSSSWQGFILANYLFYSSLVMHFIGFAHKFLHTDTKVIVQMVTKVLNILTSSAELMDLVKKIDTTFHSKAVESFKSGPNPFNKYIPTILQQLQDWEDGLCESDADGSFLHDNWNRDLRLFADGEDGGQHLLQLFLLRAESEIQSISEANLSQNLQTLDSLKAQISQLFGSPITKHLHSTHNHHEPRNEIFSPRSFGKKITRAEAKYNGDWFSNGEIARLASFLADFSGWVNERLGPLDTVRVILRTVFSWAVWAFESGWCFVRRRGGLRIDVRLLALKRMVVMVFVMAALGFLLKRVVAVFEDFR